MGSSPGFGSHPRNLRALALAVTPCSDSLSLRLHGFALPLNLRGPARGAAGPTAASMHSSDHSTKGTPLDLDRPGSKDPDRQSVLRLLVGSGFQALFHSPCGVLFTFPSRYSFPIGGQPYLALEGGPPSFPQDFACPVVLRVKQSRRV
jgi:hypothetical protein